MKKIILLLAACAAVCSVSAQQTSCIPDFIHLSGVARNANGTPVTTFIDVKVELSQGDLNSGGVLKYCEQVQNIQPNNVGEFSMDFGNPTLICNPPAVLMSGVPWTTCNMWYRLSWRITGSPTYTQIASSQFSSIPYAFAARTAENGVPSGTIIAFAGNTVPNGWLLCDGTSYGSSQYPALYNAIGSIWGGNANIFYVPDLRGRFLRGVSGASGNDPDASTRTASNTGGQTGNAVGSVQGDELKSHGHTQTRDDNLGSPGGNALPDGVGGGTTSGLDNGQTRLTGGSETRPKNANVRYIIKY